MDSAINNQTGQLELASTYTEQSRPTSGMHTCRNNSCTAVARWVKGSGRGTNEPFFRAKHDEGCDEATKIHEQVGELSENGQRYTEQPDVIEPNFYDYLMSASRISTLISADEERVDSASATGGKKYQEIEGAKKYSSRRMSVVLKNLIRAEDIYDNQKFQMTRANGDPITLPGHTAIKSFDELDPADVRKTFIVWGALQKCSFNNGILYFNSGDRQDPTICLKAGDEKLSRRILEHFKISRGKTLSDFYVIGMGVLRYTAAGGFTVWVDDYTKLWVSRS
ncbi:hypothetical protein GCM10009794_01600 [Rothia terrae]